MDYVQTYRHAASHVHEIETLLNAIKSPNNTKLVFQSLPKHMRRRAMSHHPKRLPKKYRQIHISQMQKSGKYVQIKKQKKDKNKKPQKNNGTKKKIRLETHIWHAKRFRIAEKWGYKISVSSYDKTFRACYRAISLHCLLQDISYYNCIEISGPMQIINEKFKMLTNYKTGLGLCAKTFINGNREGSLTLFKTDKYPRYCLGSVNFIWKPAENNDNKRTLWIWLHPSNYSQILEELIKILEVFNIKTNQSSDESQAATVELNRTNNIYVNNNQTVVLKELKNILNRFRLTGPLSRCVLSRCLRPKDLNENLKENWFSGVMESEINQEIHKLQSKFWSEASTNDVIPNMVLAVNVEDPRIHRPLRRCKFINEFKKNCEIDISNSPISKSFLWDSSIREYVQKSAMGNYEYDKHRSKILVPTSESYFEKLLQPIPVIFVHRPGSQNQNTSKLGYGAGWDIIIPRGYGMFFWLSLIYCGAKAGGLRETQYLMKEIGNDCFLPDTISGKIEAGEQSLILKQKYFNKPPSKRCNYNKLAIASPFRTSFKQLVQEWISSDAEVDYFILRDKEKLLELVSSIRKNNKFPDFNLGCLIQINFEMISRGNPGNFAIICIPNEIDLMNNSKNEPVLTEPLKKDEKYYERKILRLSHQKLLKRLRRSRAKEKKQSENSFKKKFEPESSKIVNAQFKKMCHLWIAEHPKSIRFQCSREVMGYVTQCNFSFINAKVTGIGYVTVEGLKKFLEMFKNQRKILIRGTKTRNYRFATFSINVNL